MQDAIEGIVHGNIIQLKSDPGIADGEEVEVIIRPRRPRPVTPDSSPMNRRSAAGLLADYADSDAALEEILRDRKTARFRETAE